MKTRTFLTSLLVGAGVALATTFTATAQPGGGGGFGGGGGGFGGGGRGGVLTQEQMQQINDALPADNADLTKLTTALAAAQKEAITAALTKDAKEADVRAKVEAVAKIQTDIAMLKFNKAVKTVAASVTADQKTQINDAPPANTYNTLFGTGRGGRGMGGGGFGGGGPGGGGRGGN